MAWIIKDVANEQIDRRSEPYLTDTMRQELQRDILPRYATKRAALLPALHTIQHAYGWIPPQALEETAAFLDLNAAEVYDTATFYEEYHLKPRGRHLVQLCRSISCELCGHNDLSQRLQAKLDILPNETTDDQRITLMELECLGACDFAPVAMIDETLHKNVTWEQLESLVDALD